MSVRIAILTVSDACSRGEREDRSGAAIQAWARGAGHHVTAHDTVPDETHRIAPRLIGWADAAIADVLLTTGGTGFGPRDVTPEATRAVLEREAAGVAEALRAAGARETPRAVLSRGIAGTRAKTLIVNLPGSLSGVTDGLAVLGPLLDHVVQLMNGNTEHRPPSGGER